MGATVLINCDKCGYKREFMLGIGFKYRPKTVFYGDAENGKEPRLVSMVGNSKIREKALKLLAEGGKPGPYGHAVYGCTKCNGLFGRFYFQIKTGEDIFEPGYRCSKCGRAMLRLDLPNPPTYPKTAAFKWPCPACAENDGLAVCVIRFYD